MFTVHTNLEMQMRPGGTAGRAGECNDISSLYGLAYLNEQSGVMTVERREPITVINHHIVPIASCVVL